MEVYFIFQFVTAHILATSVLGTLTRTLDVDEQYIKRTSFLYPQSSALGPSFRLPPQLRAEVSIFFGNYISTIYHHPALLKTQLATLLL